MVTEGAIVATTRPSENSPLCNSLTEAMNSVNSDSRGYVCMTVNGCSGLFCDFGIYFVTVWVLPCAFPPASRVVVYSSEFNELSDEILTETTKLQGPGYSIQVNLEQLDGEFGFEVNGTNKN